MIFRKFNCKLTQFQAAPRGRGRPVSYTHEKLREHCKQYKSLFQNQVLPRTDPLYTKISNEFKPHDITASALFTAINKNYNGLRSILEIPVTFNRKTFNQPKEQVNSDEESYIPSDSEDSEEAPTTLSGAISYFSSFSEEEWKEINFISRFTGNRKRKLPTRGWTHVVHQKVFSIVKVPCAFKFVFKNSVTLGHGICSECKSEVCVDLMEKEGTEQKIKIRFTPGEDISKHDKKRHVSGKLFLWIFFVNITYCFVKCF